MKSKVRESLNDGETFKLTKYLLVLGAGFVMPEKFSDEAVKEMIIHDLEDALAKPLAGEWETEIGQMVVAEDKEKMREQCHALFLKDGACPNCRWTSRLRRRSRTKDYVCTKCKEVFKF